MTELAASRDAMMEKQPRAEIATNNNKSALLKHTTIIIRFCNHTESSAYNICIYLFVCLADASHVCLYKKTCARPSVAASRMARSGSPRRSIPAMVRPLCQLCWMHRPHWRRSCRLCGLKVGVGCYPQACWVEGGRCCQVCYAEKVLQLIRDRPHLVALKPFKQRSRLA